MPIRPDQTDESRQATWAARRRAVGAKIRELRTSQGLTQESLALETGLSRNMVIGIEWGRRSVAYERLFDIATVLNVSVAQLLEAPEELPRRHVYRGGSDKPLSK